MIATISRLTIAAILMAAAPTVDSAAAPVPVAADSTLTISISEILANPHSVPDSTGEWIELRNHTDREVDLRNWIIRSANDRPHRIAAHIGIPPHGYVVLGRNMATHLNGGAPISYSWGAFLALANGADWLAVATPDGRTVDSVAWHRPVRGQAVGRLPNAPLHPDADGNSWSVQAPAFGRGDRGTPGRANVADTMLSTYRQAAAAVFPIVADTFGGIASPQAGASMSLTVRVLDVGQGDATLITNGTSIALIDGGPDAARMGHLLDSLGIRDTVVDMVVLTHPHADHYLGLQALFESRRGIRVRRFAENLDRSPNTGLHRLRDSVLARVRRGETELVSTDDPCGTGSSTCTFLLSGGARLQLLRPPPNADETNNRSAATRLLAPDSTAFTMWLSGDSGHDAIEWMLHSANYNAEPGMKSHVATANHHGSCDGINRDLLRHVMPEWMIMQLASRNDYGYVHEQTMALLRTLGIHWYRTDVNGTITITTTGSSYLVRPSRGRVDARGMSDRVSAQRACR